jgi:hypothetical protein
MGTGFTKSDIHHETSQAPPMVGDRMWHDLDDERGHALVANAW